LALFSLDFEAILSCATSCYLGDSLLLVRRWEGQEEGVREVEEETMDEHRSAPTEVKYIQSGIIMYEILILFTIASVLVYCVTSH
jgi:hypothetical protein